MRSVSFAIHQPTHLHFLKTALAAAGISSYDPAASNRPRPNLFFYQLIYAVFVSMGDRPLGTFAHWNRGKRLDAFAPVCCAIGAPGNLAEHREASDRRCIV
jgi:hypothetical protein